MSIGIAATIGMIATVAAIVLLYVKVLPKKYDGKLDNKYLQWLHNYFNFKRLYIEDILKFLFVVGTVMCVCFGFFMMFSVTETYFGDQSNFTTGLVLLISWIPITCSFFLNYRCGRQLVQYVMV